jgi:hypothetical protein
MNGFVEAIISVHCARACCAAMQVEYGYIMLTRFSKQRFAEIYRVIGDISLKYISDIDGKVKPRLPVTKLSSLTYYVSGSGEGT